MSTETDKAKKAQDKKNLDLAECRRDHTIARNAIQKTMDEASAQLQELNDQHQVDLEIIKQGITV